MISIDTNVLLRYLLADDTQQYTKARTLIHSRGPVLIVDLVVAECVWTLTGRRYGLDKPAICNLVRTLVSDSLLLFEDIQIIWKALRDFEESRTVAGKALDFPDALIAARAMSLGAVQLFSFDKAVQQLKGATRP